MKLVEATGKSYSVIRYSDKKRLFSDTREACIKFIKEFDKESDKYVDLRLIDPDSREDDWHKD